jgi:hypothetical protein
VRSLTPVHARRRVRPQLKRHNYVTPTNYLELVKGYKSVLEERRGTLSGSCSKLGNGLTKLEQARSQVCHLLCVWHRFYIHCASNIERLLYDRSTT